MLLEPHYERVSAALVERFREIQADGETYHYSIDRVARILEWERIHLDETLADQTHMLFLKPESGEESEGSTSRVDGRADFAVLILRKDSRASRNPFEEEKEPGPAAVTIVSRAVEDVRTCLFRNLQLVVDGEQLAWNVMDGPSVVDYSFPVDGWLAAVLKFTVRYDYPRAD